MKTTLSAIDAVAIIVGIVIGAGIFKTPSLVAASLGNGPGILLIWALGGALSAVGALCYAELTSAYPHPGGDYHYIRRAFGGAPAFLFAWARMTIIQAGSIAMLAFLIGDYASEILPLGKYSASLYAGLAVAGLTGINIAGIRPGSWIQKTFTGLIVGGMLLIVIVGAALAFPRGMEEGQRTAGSPLGRALIFVLLTYGGWNEAAYLSSEIAHPARDMTRVLLYSLGIITVIYIVFNAALLGGLGLAAVSRSSAVAADLMRQAFGENGARFISFLVAAAAVSTMNGTIITGARTNYALGRDFRLFRFLDRWNDRSGTPARGLLVQAGIAALLIALATGSRDGFVAMVEYTAPVFWFFFLLVSVSLFVLRFKEPGVFRPFRVPLYPFVPIAFCGICAYMLVSSLTYTGQGAVMGLIVLGSGIPLLLIERGRG